MPSKRLNIMLYSSSGGEQIILPINPMSIDIKYEKFCKTYNVLGVGNVNVVGQKEPLRIKLSHFLPEDDSVFGTNSNIMYDKNGNANFIQYEYSSLKAVEILKKWAFEQTKIRLVIDDEINLECYVVSFTETIRENTSSKPYVLEAVEYIDLNGNIQGKFGLYQRFSSLYVPKIILAKSNDTIYSIASKYSLNFKTLCQKNGIQNPNASITGKKIII